MANTAPQSYTIPVDPYGNWELRLPNVFTPGTKAVVVTPDQQSFQEVVLVTVEGNWPAHTRIVERMPTIFLSALWLLLLALTVFAAYHMYVVRRHGHKKASAAQHQAVRTLITFTSLLAVALVIGTVFILHLTTDFGRSWRGWGSNDGILSATEYVQVSGAVVDPLSGLGVAGVDLVSGDTAIHTSDGGRFTFAQVVPSVGIRLTYPGLLRTIVKLVDDVPVMNIPFSVAMYNQLITVVDAEGRGRLQTIYDQLPTPLKEQQSFDAFRKDYRSIFSLDSVMNQEITVAEVTAVRSRRMSGVDLQFDVLYKIVLQNGESRGAYNLGLIAGQWYVVQ